MSHPVVRPRNPKFQDLTGQTFGLLVVDSLAGWDKQKRAVWNCKCACGTTKPVRAWNLKNGHNSSCGCLRRALEGSRNKTHGRTETRAYTAWLSMRRRCYYEKGKDYPDYGGRGITVCERWRESFAAFHADMGDPPAGMSIERIDNAKGYEPDNCRWATGVEQGRNKRNNRRLTLNGRTLTAAEWARELGWPRKTIYSRLAAGWSDEDILTRPR